MRNRLLAVVLFITLIGNLAVFAQQLDPVKPDSNELITPVNAQPLSIETMARRRGLVVDAPARNLIIFCTSGFTGASAAFRDAYTSSGRDAIRWQGFQLIFPAWADRQKGTRNSLIQAISQFGKHLAMVSDHNFILPGMMQGIDELKMPDLSAFSMAVSFSEKPEVAERAQLMQNTGTASQTTTDLTGLERLFTSRSPRITACLPQSDSAKPGFAEIVSAIVSRSAMAPEGFCAIVNLSAVARHRKANNFSRMLESMRLRESLLKQLETFTSGRKDTLLIVIDEPENGHWKVGEQFAAADFVDALKKLPGLYAGLETPNANIEDVLKSFGSEYEFPVNEIGEAVSAGRHDQAHNLIEQAVNRRFDLSFSHFDYEGGCSGQTVLAQGQNADLFFGISSFPEFFRRLSLAIGLEASAKQ